jgi:hypothetical protein
MSYRSGSRAEKLQSLVAYPQGLLPLLHLPCELMTAAARGGDVRRSALHYLQKFRTCLASSLSTAFFPRRHGLPIHPHSGMRIPAHLLRYVAVVLFISAMRSS